MNLSSDEDSTIRYYHEVPSLLLYDEVTILSRQVAYILLSEEDIQIRSQVAIILVSDDEEIIASQRVSIQ